MPRWLWEPLLFILLFWGPILAFGGVMLWLIWPALTWRPPK